MPTQELHNTYQGSEQYHHLHLEGEEDKDEVSEEDELEEEEDEDEGSLVVTGGKKKKKDKKLVFLSRSVLQKIRERPMTTGT